MTTREMGIEDARARLGDLVRDAQQHGMSTRITRNGKPAAILIPDTGAATFTAFALDNTVPRGPHDGSDDDFSVVPGITVEDAEGRHVAGKNMQWPDGRFAADLADETLGRMGFRRTGEWTWHDWDWRAPLARKRPQEAAISELEKS